MVEIMPLPNETVTSLAMALVESSKAPLLLLDDDVVVLGASASFCNTFNLDPATIANRRLADVGAGDGTFANSIHFSARRSPEQRKLTLIRWTSFVKARRPAVSF
jgi:hypothetical protein